MMMRTLEKALLDHELLVLRVIGEWWEVDLTGADKMACVNKLAETMRQLDMQQEMIFLPPEEAAAMRDLITAGGRMPVATFSRKYGEVRLMGPGRLEREEPWMEPISSAEALWYRGFLFRAFDETPEGMIEFCYLPEELLSQFPAPAEDEVGETAVPGLTPAGAPEAFTEAVTDIVDDLTTLLGAAQSGLLQAGDERWRSLLLNDDEDRLSMITALARELGFLRATPEDLRPTRAAVAWLKQSRESQLRALADAWSRSGWNELRHVPALICEGENWSNDPILARTALLDAMPRSSDWFLLDDLVEHIKATAPDFQRPDGNYDTWYVRDAASNEFLTGFTSWDSVEGRLLRYLVQGPLVWLGLVETAAGRYRLTSRALAWLADEPAVRDEVRVPIVVNADASLIVPYNADRYQRFQVARISEAGPMKPGQPFHYRLTPASLQRAKQQGIMPERILKFLGDASGRPVPASVKRALARWAERGVEARVEETVVLRVRDAAILETLRANPKTRDFIGESLGDLAAVVRRDQWPQFVAATAQLGLLLDVNAGESG
ncbi:MAG: helicase-associated domain-containing protein [Anaerolineae bacterium]